MEINIILCESGCGIFDLHLSFISLRFKWKLKEKNKRSITELALILFMRALARIAETTTVTQAGAVVMTLQRLELYFGTQFFLVDLETEKCSHTSDSSGGYLDCTVQVNRL